MSHKNKTSNKLASVKSTKAAASLSRRNKDDVDDDYSYGADSQASLSTASQEDLNGDFNESGLASNNKAAIEMSDEYKAQEVNMEWDTVEYHFDHEFDLSELVTEGNKGLKMDGTGVLKMTVDNGILEMGYRSKDSDFTNLDCGACDASASSSAKKKAAKEKQQQQAIQNSDIVKSAYLENLKITGWNERVLIGLSTVPKFKEEGHYGNSETVNHMVYPHEWHGETAKPIKLADRKVTGSQINFQKRFPGVSPENLAQHISKSGTDDFLVKLDSPLVAIINLAKGADNESGEYTTPDLVKTNQVLVPKKLVKAFTPKTLEAMRGISYANITDNRFEVTFEAPIPSSLMNEHKKYITSKGLAGRQFLCFADTSYKNRLCLGSTINDNIKTKAELFKNPVSQFVHIQGKLVLKYKKMNQETLDEL